MPAFLGLCVMHAQKVLIMSTFRWHMNLHNGVKTYKCTKCDRGFAHQSDLSRHVALVALLGRSFPAPCATSLSSVHSI
jgi:hypothetical protein